MSFLGENRNPAPKLKEAKLSDAEWQIAYEQCVAVSLLMERFVDNLKNIILGDCYQRSSHEARGCSSILLIWNVWTSCLFFQTMKRMFSECKLVHADLSEYNMLWYKDTVYFIDVAQAVDSMHPRAMEFLLRDCQNVSEVIFFILADSVRQIIFSSISIFN